MLRIVTLVLLIALAPQSAFAVNEFASLPMHATITSFGLCDLPSPCPDPLVEVPAGSQVAAYLLVDNYDFVAGVQTAFDFGGWTLVFGLWDCQSNQLSATTPQAPGGPDAGTIATAFDCISGGATAVVGRMQLVAGSGCISQVESSFPFGTHVVDCSANITSIEVEDRGSICVDAPGVNACRIEDCVAICDAGGPYAGFEGVPIQFDGSGAVGTTLIWDFGDGSSATGVMPEHTYQSAGSFTVTQTAQSAVCQKFCTTVAEIDAAIPVTPTTWGRIKAHHRTRN